MARKRKNPDTPPAEESAREPGRLWDCTACPAVRNAHRCPSGWKHLPTGLHCKDCAKKGFRVRAASLPVARPVQFIPAARTKAAPYELSWGELHLRLRCAWEACRRLANLAVREMARHDVPPMPGQMLPADALPSPYARIMTAGGPRAEGEWVKWIGAAASANIVLRNAHRRYLRDRAAVYLAGTQSLPSFSQRQYALPVHAANWAVEERDGMLLLAFPLPALRLEDALPADRVAEAAASMGHAGRAMLPEGKAVVAIKCGREFARQVAGLRLVMAGTARQSEASIYAQPGGGHAKGESREPGGGQRRRHHVMARFIFTAPFAAPEPGQRVLLLRSCPDRFIHAQREGAEAGESAVYEHCGDHVAAFERAIDEAVRRTGRTWEAAQGLIGRHEDFRQRHAHDRWHEGRVQARQRRQHKDLLERRCAKQRERIKTYILQQCAAIARACRQQRVGCVILDLACRSYYRSFPWHFFRDRLRQVLEAGRITMTVLGLPALQDAAPALEMEQEVPEPA